MADKILVKKLEQLTFAYFVTVVMCNCRRNETVVKIIVAFFMWLFKNCANEGMSLSIFADLGAWNCITLGNHWPITGCFPESMHNKTSNCSIIVSSVL